MKTSRVNKKLGIALSLVIGAGLYGVSTTYAAYGSDTHPVQESAYQNALEPGKELDKEEQNQNGSDVYVSVYHESFNNTAYLAYGDMKGKTLNIGDLSVKGITGRSGIGASQGLDSNNAIMGINGGIGSIVAVQSSNIANANIVFHGDVVAVGGTADYESAKADGKNGINGVTDSNLNAGAAAAGGNGGSAIATAVDIAGSGNTITAADDMFIVAEAADGAQGGNGGNGGTGLAGASYPGHAQDGTHGANGTGNGSNGGDGTVGSDGATGNAGAAGGLSTDGATGGNGGDATATGFKIADSITATNINLAGLSINAIAGDGGDGGQGGIGGNGGVGGIGQEGGAGGNAGNGSNATTNLSDGGNAGAAAAGGDGGNGGIGGAGTAGGNGGVGGNGGAANILGLSAANSLINMTVGDLSLVAMGGNGGAAGAGGAGGNGAAGGAGGNGGQGGQGGTGGAGTGGSHGNNSSNANYGDGGNGGNGGAGGNGGDAGLTTGNGGNANILGFDIQDASTVVLNINATDTINVIAKGGNAGIGALGGAVGTGGTGGAAGTGHTNGTAGTAGANGTTIGDDTPLAGIGDAGTADILFANVDGGSSMAITANQDLNIVAMGGDGQTVGDVDAAFANVDEQSSFTYIGKDVNVLAMGSVQAIDPDPSNPFPFIPGNALQTGDVGTYATGIYAEDSNVQLKVDNLHVTAMAAAGGDADTDGLEYYGATKSIVEVTEDIATMAIGGMSIDGNGGAANAYGVYISNRDNPEQYNVSVTAGGSISTTAEGGDGEDGAGYANAATISAYGNGILRVNTIGDIRAEATGGYSNAAIGTSGDADARAVSLAADGDESYAAKIVSAEGSIRAIATAGNTNADNTAGEATARAVSADGKGYLHLEAEEITAQAVSLGDDFDKDGKASAEALIVTGYGETGKQDTAAFVKTDFIGAMATGKDVTATAIAVDNATLMLAAKTAGETIRVQAIIGDEDFDNEYIVSPTDIDITAMKAADAKVIVTDDIEFTGDVNINNSTVILTKGADIYQSEYYDSKDNVDKIASEGNLTLVNSTLITNGNVYVDNSNDSLIKDSTIKMYTSYKQVGNQMVVDYENIYQKKQDFNFMDLGYEGASGVTDTTTISGTNNIALRTNAQAVDIGYGREQSIIYRDITRGPGQTPVTGGDSIFIYNDLVAGDPAVGGTKPVINIDVFDQGMRNGFMTDQKEVVFAKERVLIGTEDSTNFATDVEINLKDQKYDNGTFAYTYGVNGEFNADGDAFVMTGATIKDVKLSNIPKAAHQSRAAMLSMMNAENDTLAQRLGELRGQQAENGVWARYVGGKETTNIAFGDVKTTYNGVQIGYDRALGNSKEWNIGITGSYIDGKADVFSGHSDLSSKTIGLYTTYANEKGHFFDAIIKTGRISNKYQSFGGTIGQLTGADYSSNMFMGSVEYGYKHDMSNKWFIEPSVQFSMGRLGSHDYSIATQDGLTNIKADSIQSTLLRAGIKLGTNNEKGANFYVKLGVAHEFQGNVKTGIFADGKYVGIEDKLKGTSFEYGLGINGKMGKTSNYYVDVASTSGGKIKKELALSAGVRFGF